MGQYYKTVIVRENKSDDKDILSVDNDCEFRCSWVGLKLMEHSYLHNIWIETIAFFIYKQRVRMAHVGDYAYEYPQYELAYNNHVKRENVDTSQCFNDNGDRIYFDYKDKYLVNWDKAIYINFNEYMKLSKASWAEDVVVCPFTLLTALGNGRGGGDYWENNPNFNQIGTWAWDLISIEDSVPENCTEFPIYFTE